MTEITQIDIPFVFNAQPPVEIIGGMTQSPISFESLSRVYTPESARRDIGVIILPGFGHHVNALGKAFENHARTIAKQLNVISAVAVDNESDENGLAFWQIPGGGKTWALKETIRYFLDRSIPNHVVIGFSNSAYDATEVASGAPSVIGLVLIAPTANPWRIIETMKKAGRPISADPQDARSLLVGSRRTLVVHDLSGDVEATARAAAEDMRVSAESIRRRRIPVSVLWGMGDSIVPKKQSEEVAKLLGIKIISVDPQATERSCIHDFDSVYMRDAIIQELRTKHFLL